jgi:GxxExxY protein
MDLNELSSKIIQAAIEVHKELGPGLFESVYRKCLAFALREMGLKVEEEVPVPIDFRGHRIQDEGFRIDLLVEDAIICELKAVETMNKLFKRQLLTHLRLSKKTLGLLINFNVEMLKDGITRMVN